MKKRGELTTQQLIGLIILIVSFGVILFLIFRLDLGETSKKEICHNSVLLQDKSLNFGSSYLDCTTSYICVSGGGNCEGFSADSKINIDLSKDIENQVMDAIAEEMADCWWMFREGKVDYSGEFNLDKVIGNKVCSLCSVIAFDDKLMGVKISYEDFYKYLEKTKKDNSQTYKNYLFGTFDITSPEGDIKMDKQYVVLTGVAKEGVLSMAVSGAIFAANPILGFFYEADRREKKEQKKEIFSPMFLEKNSEDYVKLECKEFLTKS